MAETEKCPKETWDGWRSYTCGRPVKRDGLCGIHAGAKDRAERQRQEKAAARAKLTERSTATVARLAEHGIEAQVFSDGRIWLPPADKIADALDRRYASEGAGDE